MARMAAKYKLLLLAACAAAGLLLPGSAGLAVLAASVAAHAIERKSFFAEIADRPAIILFAALPAVFFLLLGFPDWQALVLNSFAYLCGMLSLASLLSATTGMAEIAQALSSLGAGREISFAFPLALRSSRTFSASLSKTRRAQSSRGGGGVFPILVPLFHSLFKRARALAYSLESRGFSSE